MKHLLLILITMLTSCATKTKTTGQFNQNPRISIPVMINNKEYSFLFDTGAERSSMSKITADLIGIKETKDSVSMDGLMRKGIPGVFTVPIDISINGYVTNIPWITSKEFYINEPYNGIIGLDVINQFYWKFDLVTNQFELSIRPFIDSVIPQNSLILPYQISKGTQKMIVNLSLNNTDSIACVFDTGASISYPLQQKEIFSDICLSHEYEDFEHTNQRFDLQITLQGDSKEDKSKYPFLHKFAIAHDVKLHNIDSIPLILAFTELPRHYLPLGFVQHFSQMYINPEKQEIVLINHRTGKKAKTTEIRDFINSVLTSNKKEE